jgi:ribosomal protein S18 acetylase RimI-like enzyme
MACSFREFRSADAESASRMLREAFQWFHKGNTESWLWQSFEPSRLISNSATQDILVAVDDETNVVIGYIASSTTPYKVTYIPMVAVARARQGKGLGRKLLEEKLARLANDGIRKVWLLVTSTNTNAIVFYLRNKFVIEGYLKDHTGPGSDEVLFSRFLSE